MTKELLTKQEVAKKYKVSTRTVDRWRSVGILKAFKVGSTVRFRVDKLVEMEDKVMKRRYGNSNQDSNQTLTC